jgi:hypothetical protein
MIVSEEKVALLHPIEESEQRIKNLHGTIADAERSLGDVGFLFMAEQRRLSDTLRERRKHFLAEALPQAHAEFEEASKSRKRCYGPSLPRDSMRAAQKVAEQSFLPWLKAEQALAEDEYRKVASRFVSIGNDFLKRLSESGVRELERMPNALDSEKGFRVPSRFSFEGLIHVAQPASPLRYVGDVFLGAVGWFSAIRRDAWEFLDHLMDMNSTCVRSDVVSSAQESRNQLEVDIRKLLHEVSRIAEHAFNRARAPQAEGAPGMAAVRTRLDAVEREILAIRQSESPAISISREA